MFSYLAFVLSTVAIILLTEGDALCIMMMIMPFANIFKSSAGAQSFFTYLILLFVLWRFLKKQRVHRAFFFMIAFLIVYLSAQMSVSVNILRTIKFVANLLFIYLAVEAIDSDRVKKMCICYILGITASSLVAVLNIIPNLSDYIGAKDISIEYERVSRFAGMYADPNYYSINIIISLCLIVILNHKKEISTILAIGLGCLLVMFSVLTLSKSAFLMLSLPLTFLLYSKAKTKKYFMFLFVLIICSIVAFEMFSGNIEVLNDILFRFDNASDMASLTTGRSNIWLYYFNYLISNPIALLFGKGFGAALLNSHAAHNTYIDLLYHLGIIGTALMLLVMGKIIYIKTSPTKLNLLNHSIWICIAVMYFFLSELFYFDWPFHIIIAIGISKMNMTQVKEEKNDS